MGEIDQAVANRLATGAAGVITLGGVEYSVGQPTDKDHAALGARMQQIAAKQRQERLRYYMKDLGSLAAAVEFLAETEPPFDVTTAEGLQRVLMTAEGCRFLAWSLIRKEQPEVTLAHFTDAITDETAAVIALELMDACGMLAISPNSDGGTGSGARSTTNPTARSNGASSATPTSSPPG